MDTVGNFLISIAEQVGHIQIHIIDCLPVLSFFLGERFITFLQDELNDIRFIDFLKKERSEIIAFWEALKRK